MSKPSIELEKLEEILRRETSCIDETDVPVVMHSIYTSLGLPTPNVLLAEIEQNEHDRGDCDEEDCVHCQDDADDEEDGDGEDE